MKSVYLCDITYAHILDNFNFDLIPTPNVPIYKFKYQSMLDHYADHPKGTGVKVLRALMHNSKMCRKSNETPCIILKYAGYQKRPSCNTNMSLHLPIYC